MLFLPFQINDIIQMKAKRGGFKYRLIGVNVKTGKEVKQVKPADRKFVLVSGDASHIVIKKVEEEEDKASSKSAADFDMASGTAGAALTVPIRAGEVRKGTHVMLKGHPCKTVEVSISKTGKHGHAKANITGIDVFTGKKYVEISPTSHNMTSPVMFRSEWMVTDIAMPQGNLTLMDAAGAQREDIDLPRDTSGNFTAVSNDLIAKFNSCADGRAVFATVLKAMSTEQVVDIMVKDASA